MRFNSLELALAHRMTHRMTRDGRVWPAKGNYALSGRTSHARTCAGARGVSAVRSEPLQSERCPHAGAARQRAVPTWTSTSMSHSFDALRGGDHGVGSGVFTRPEPDGT